jgi:hypothetical protein
MISKNMLWNPPLILFNHYILSLELENP